MKETLCTHINTPVPLQSIYAVLSVNGRTDKPLQLRLLIQHPFRVHMYTLLFIYLIYRHFCFLLAFCLLFYCTARAHTVTMPCHYFPYAIICLICFALSFYIVFYLQLCRVLFIYVFHKFYYAYLLFALLSFLIFF